MPSKRVINGKVYYVGQVKKEGKRKQKLFQKKSEAKEWELKLKKMRVEDWEGPIGMVCLGDWANKFLDYAKIKYTLKTHKDYQRVFKAFFKAVAPENTVTELKQGMVLNYLQIQAEVRTGNAANKDRKRLVAAWNWGIKYMDLPSSNPCIVDKFSENRQKRYIPPEKDFWKVYDVAEGQDRVMLLTYLHTAARRGEVFRLRWDDIDFGGSRIQLFTRKRKDGSLEGNWIPMTEDLFSELLNHRRSAVNELVFPDPKTGQQYVRRIRWMSRLCEKAGVKHFGVHAIRHLTASILAQAGIPAIQIQYILRHKSLETTERYLHQLMDVRPALKVLEGKRPSKGTSSGSDEKILSKAQLQVV